MERVQISRVRLRRYKKAAEESSIALQQAIADAASGDALRLLEAGDVERAGGAVMVMIGATLLRAAARAGGDDVPVHADLEEKSRSADLLNRIGAPLAAAMVRAAVVYERVRFAGEPAPRRPSGRR